MSIAVLEEVEAPSGDLEFIYIYWLLIFRIDLLGALNLIKVVVAPEILIINPDISEGKPHLSLIQRGYLLIQVWLRTVIRYSSQAKLGFQGERPSLSIY